MFKKLFRAIKECFHFWLVGPEPEPSGDSERSKPEVSERDSLVYRGLPYQRSQSVKKQFGSQP